MNRSALPTVAAACLGWLFSALDIVLLIFFQEQVAQALDVDIQKVRITIGVGLLGSAAGGLLFSQLGDRHGRVRALGWAVICYSVATAGMALAPNIGVLMALRFLAGIGTGGEWSLGFALVAEVWTKERRGALGGLVTGMFNLGTFIAILLYHLGLGWRVAFGIMLFPALGVLWLRRRVPESPTWVALQLARKEGRVDAAVGAAMARAPVSAVFRGRFGGVTLKLTLLFLLLNLGFYAFSTIFIGYLQAAPATGGLGLRPDQELPFHLALNLSALVGVMGAGALSDRIGRRAAFALACGVGAVGFGWLYLILRGADPAAGPPSGLVLAFALACAGSGVNGVMGAYAPELYPTHLRSTGPGVAQNLGKGIGGMAGPPLAGALLPTLGYPVVLALPGLAFIALGLLVWMLPPVGGRALEPVEGEELLRARR